jgi:hypothetical protein
MSTSTPDFKTFLEGAMPENYQEVYALYKAVEGCSSFGIYDVMPARGSSDRWIVSTSYSDQSLLLASTAAKEALLLREIHTGSCVNV